ncbi:topology modulation protein [Aurantimonas sp. VKM B-3413]|uniref:topology modulation protein n=1 Tax=Aurantimonas sp. VKM B-3413 TaxID=2779401 RepID=UPI001E44F0D1|nr:topology modulation protein [Aurantimonas sp. VKM B-3413]MCB8838777.1 topology modulation protein [Aurantimonas sp. VKM B-3413]
MREAPLTRPVIGRNVMVIGSPGSGKSTLTRALASRYQLRPIHMDQLYWMPGWRVRHGEQLLALVEEAILADGWVFDGNYSRSFAIRGERADTLIWLDMSRSLCLARVVRRIATGYGSVRPDMAHGCPERFDLGFLRYVWTFPRHSAPGLARFYDGFSRSKYRLTSPAEVAGFLDHAGMAALR